MPKKRKMQTIYLLIDYQHTTLGGNGVYLLSRICPNGVEMI